MSEILYSHSQAILISLISCLQKVLDMLTFVTKKRGYHAGSSEGVDLIFSLCFLLTLYLNSLLKSSASDGSISSNPFPISSTKPVMRDVLPITSTLSKSDFHLLKISFTSSRPSVGFMRSEFLLIVHHHFQLPEPRILLLSYI